MEETKVCTICKEEFPANEEWFNRAKQNKDGLKGYCRKCNSEYSKDHYRNNIEKYKKEEKNITKITKKKYYKKAKIG